MTDHQYYTPDISDLFVGYECEVNTRDGFIKKTLASPYEFKMALEQLYRYRRIKQASDSDPDNWFLGDGVVAAAQEIRTPFLTREQIEAEGWKEPPVKNVPGPGNDPNTIQLFCFSDSPRGSCDYHLIYVPKSKWLLLSIRYPSDDYPNVIFAGKSPSINEFRRICKMVGIIHQPAENT